ncbi:hypothetical protein HYC85_029261 [Camellia sinensis]|uniref:DUF4283 domain-containing protein n=1 Tax=Camellia sinensis TaxID=4442 RepID=A0A7J7FXI0_CAMSI|nr:hypothetical protein HYC85_029261 [Camellia sinensis]
MSDSGNTGNTKPNPSTGNNPMSQSGSDKNPMDLQRILDRLQRMKDNIANSLDVAKNRAEGKKCDVATLQSESSLNLEGQNSDNDSEYFGVGDCDVSQNRGGGNNTRGGRGGRGQGGGMGYERVPEPKKTWVDVAAKSDRACIPLSLWKKKGLKEVLANGEGFIFFIFESPSCCSEVLEGGPWYIGGFHLILKQWTRMMKLTKDKIQKYQGLPVKCEYCHVFGHDTTKCVTTQVAKLVNVHKETENNPDPGWSTVKVKGKRKVGDPDPDPIEVEMEEPEIREDAMASEVDRKALAGVTQIPDTVVNAQISEQTNNAGIKNVVISGGTQRNLGEDASSGNIMSPKLDGLAELRNEPLDIAMLALPEDTEMMEKVRNLPTSVESPPITPDTLPTSSSTKKSSGKGKGQRKKTRPISDQEIKHVLWSLKPNKALGPDGFSAGFFKSAWSIVGKEVTLAIRSFFESGKLLTEVNNTTIALIPKVPNPVKVGDYRPISCCNTIYKCIAKIIANRIKVVLPDLIDPIQSAFVHWRRISDNIFSSQELMRVFMDISNVLEVLGKVTVDTPFLTVLKTWTFGVGFKLKEAIGAPFVKGSSRVQRVAELIQNSQCLPFAEARFMAAQNTEEIVVMTAALEQGTAPQSEASISMSHPPRLPVVHPVWAPQLYQAREPTTFELMGMIGDLQRSVADLAYGMSASPPAAPYAGNFVPQEPPLLGRIVIELSQPEVASGYSHDMPASTPTLDQAEARGKDKAKVDADPIEQLLWAVEALKVRGMNKQQTSTIVIKAVDDAFPAPIKGSSSQTENRDGPRHAQTIPVVPNPASGKVQKAKAAPADPFASASDKNPQTTKYLPRGRRVFHDLNMPLSRALLILAKNGHLKPLEPRPLPKNLPTTHDATLYCAYHQQSGHSTDGCSRLRHEVQDLIDNKVILPPTSGKPVTTQLLDFESVSAKEPVTPTKLIETVVAISNFMLAFSISAREFDWADSTSRLLSCAPNSLH